MFLFFPLELSTVSNIPGSGFVPSPCALFPDKLVCFSTPTGYEIDADQLLPAIAEDVTNSV
jgi:hypothetical protein